MFIDLALTSMVIARQVLRHRARCPWTSHLMFLDITREVIRHRTLCSSTPHAPSMDVSVRFSDIPRHVHEHRT